MSDELLLALAEGAVLVLWALIAWGGCLLCRWLARDTAGYGRAVSQLRDAERELSRIEADEVRTQITRKELL